MQAIIFIIIDQLQLGYYFLFKLIANFISVTAQFTIVNEAGEDGQGRGLLLYNGYTVCDDSFSNNSAIAICGMMGYDGFDSWRNGEFFDIQDDLEIGLDDVVCTSGSWDSCSSTTSHNCRHYEDVHLNCVPEGKSYTICKQYSSL